MGLGGCIGEGWTGSLLGQLWGGSQRGQINKPWVSNIVRVILKMNQST